MLFLFFAPPLYAKYNYSLETTNIIRDTQLLLSLTGVYTGPLDGLCNAQTKQAINESTLAKTRLDKSLEITCNIESLEAIKNDLRSVLMAGASITHSTATHNGNDVNDTITINSLSRELDDIKVSIRNTNAALKGMADGFAANFLNQYNGLASTGMTIFITGISVTIAVIALVSNLLRDFITKSVETSHNKFLEESNTMLQQAKNAILDQSNTTLQQAKETILQQAKEESKTMLLAQAVLSTQLYGTLGGHIVYFYQDLAHPEGTDKNIYTTYLSIGVRISTYGNQFVNRLIDLFIYKTKN